jgi:hypothetical protein
MLDPRIYATHSTQGPANPCELAHPTWHPIGIQLLAIEAGGGITFWTIPV